jgi:glycosyltransferase involved in cell wall biosynthesis
VLFHCHSYLGPGAVRDLAAFGLRSTAARLVAQCEFVAGQWHLYVRPAHTSVIYNGVAGPPRTLPRPSSGPPRIGCIGRIAPEKGQREFVAAAARIHRMLPECRFLIYGAPLFGEIAGTQYAEQVRADAQGLPVEFAGWAENVYAAMAQLDLLLVPSAPHEATTRVILEAFAAYLPVIAFPSGGIPEVIEDGVTGLLADTSQHMAQLATELLTGNARRLISIAQAAHESWARRFTLDRYRRQILAAIQAATNAPFPR